MTNEPRTFIAYITKYALTQGILKMKVETTDVSEDMVVHRKPGEMGQYFHGNDWHETQEAAENRFKEMKKKKIQSLKKQIKKIESMAFKIVTV